MHSIYIDAHVHIYPFYDINAAIKKSITAFHHNGAGKEDINFWLLTEGYDYRFFAGLLSAKLNYQIEQTDDPESLVIMDKSSRAPLIYVIAGRQIVTSDNLEICAFGTNIVPKDRVYSTLDTIKMVQDNGAIPALNWAPGKWFFHRGNVVKSVLDTVSPKTLLISETTMRPTIWPTPVLMKYAIAKGFKVICGSDPLPFQNEEKFIGSYCTNLNAPFTPAKPVEFIKSVLLDPDIQFTVKGKRNNALTFAKRQYKIMSRKH